MGQKVNPVGMRIGIIRDWEAKWYAPKTKVADLLQTNSYEAVDYLKSVLPTLSLSDRLIGTNIIKNAGDRYNEYVDKAKNAAKDYRSASNKGRGGWMTFTDWVGDLFGGDKDENIKEAQSAGEFAQSLISALESSIQMETGEEISDELSKLLENAVISGFENLDEDKLKKLGEDEIRGIIDNVTSFISSEEFKTLNTEIENGFKMPNLKEIVNICNFFKIGTQESLEYEDVWIAK